MNLNEVDLEKLDFLNKHWKLLSICVANNLHQLDENFLFDSSIQCPRDDAILNFKSEFLNILNDLCEFYEIQK